MAKRTAWKRLGYTSTAHAPGGQEVAQGGDGAADGRLQHGEGSELRGQSVHGFRCNFKRPQRPNCVTLRGGYDLTP